MSDGAAEKGRHACAGGEAGGYWGWIQLHARGGDGEEAAVGPRKLPKMSHV